MVIGQRSPMSMQWNHSRRLERNLFVSARIWLVAAAQEVIETTTTATTVWVERSDYGVIIVTPKERLLVGVNRSRLCLWLGRVSLLAVHGPKLSKVSVFH